MLLKLIISCICLHLFLHVRYLDRMRLREAFHQRGYRKSHHYGNQPSLTTSALESPSSSQLRNESLNGLQDKDDMQVVPTRTIAAKLDSKGTTHKARSMHTSSIKTEEWKRQIAALTIQLAFRQVDP
jgi:hypothetical protein